MSNIKPELPGGFKDYLPEQQSKRLEIIDTLRKKAELFGFVPVDTPAIERKEVLTKGEEDMEKQIFEIERDDEKQSMALRFDLTVPLSRLMAAYPRVLEKPFKRYQYGRLWRGEKPQVGRYREFMQFDVDIVGSPGVEADAEIISYIYESLIDLDVGHFTIKLNSRKILDQLPKIAGFDNDLLNNVLRIIDKLDKIEWSGVEEELSDTGLNKKQIKTIKEFIELKEETPQTLLGSIRSILEDSGSDLEGVEEMEKLVDYLYNFDISDKNWTIDLSIARGFGYYTGPIFETVLDNSDVGSIFSGGRYDNLMEQFSGSPMPAVGASLGVDRLLSVIDTEDNSVSSDVLVLNFDKSVTSYCIKTLKSLRKEGISSEIYTGQDESLKGQLSYGIKREFPVIIIAGSDEKESETVQIKNTEKEEQEEVSLDKSVEKIREILN